MTTQNSYNVVLVSWIDAHAGSQGGWEGLDPDDQSEYINQTVGFLITDDNGGKANHVTIAQSLSPEELVDHVIHIPKVMVRSLTFYQQFTKDLTM